MPYNSIISRSDAAALVPEQVSALMLADLAAPQGSAALRLGTRVPVATNQTRFPVLSALPIAYWVNGDTGLKQTTEAAWANKYLNIEELACIVPVPENVLDDVGFDMWAALQPLMTEAIARALDAAIFFGTDAPASFPDDISTAAIAAGNTIFRGTNNAAAGGLWQDLIDVMATVWADGYAVTGGIANPTVRARTLSVRDTTGAATPAPADLPPISYTDMPGLWPATGDSDVEVIVGSFRNLVVGVRRDFTWKLITEGVITDTNGDIIFNLPQQDMVAMRLVFRAGWEVANPINRYQGTEADRYPFGVLRSPNV